MKPLSLSGIHSTQRGMKLIANIACWSGRLYLEKNICWCIQFFTTSSVTKPASWRNLNILSWQNCCQHVKGWLSCPRDSWFLDWTSHQTSSDLQYLQYYIILECLWKGLCLRQTNISSVQYLTLPNMFHFLWRSHLPTLVISSQIFVVQYCTDNVSLFAALHSLNGLYKCM